MRFVFSVDLLGASQVFLRVDMNRKSSKDEQCEKRAFRLKSSFWEHRLVDDVWTF